MSMNEKRDYRRFSADQKYQIVKEKLTTDMSVSEICKKYSISSTLFYQWQEKFLSSAREGMSGGSGGVTKAEHRKLEKKDREIDRMREVIAEITAENVELKKKNSDW